MGMAGKSILLVLFGLGVLAQVAEGVEVCTVADLQLVTQTGEFFLAAVFLVMGITTTVYVMMAFRATHEKRHFYFCCCFMTLISTFSYYAMLSGQAWMITPNCRQLFYVRYIDWAGSTPLIILIMGMVAGVDGVFIAAVMGADVMMIFGGFMSTITDGHIKWIWFCLSLIVFFPVVFVMLVSFRRSADMHHPSVGELYNKLAWITVISWACYPVVFAISDLAGEWSPNFEILMYACLDVVSKIVFCYVLALSHEALDNASGLPYFQLETAVVYGTDGTNSSKQAFGGAQSVGNRNSRTVESYV